MCLKKVSHKKAMLWIRIQIVSVFSNFVRICIPNVFGSTILKKPVQAQFRPAQGAPPPPQILRTPL